MPPRSLLWCLASAAAYGALLAPGDLREAPGVLLGSLAVLAAAYLALAASLLGRAPSPSETRLLLGAAIAFRLLLLPAEPSLSDDVYRYLWDGKVLLATGNPYRYAPADPALAALRDARAARVNYPELPTIYPPAAQILFALGSLAGPASLLATKALLLGAEGALALSLVALLRAAGLPAHRALLYLLHPLAIVEVAHSGHLEPAAVAALVAAALAAERRRPAALGGFLALSVLTKVLALALVPQAARRMGWRGAAVLGALLVGAYVPFLDAGSNLLRSLWEYGSRWRWWDTGHAAILATVRATGLGERLAPLLASAGEVLHPPEGATELSRMAADEVVARGLVILAFAAVLAACAARRLSLHDAALPVTSAFCLLTPTLHPWYVLWLLPWLCLRPVRSLILYTVLVPFSYATFLWPAPAGGWQEPSAIKWGSLAAVALLFAWDSRPAARRAPPVASPDGAPGTLRAP